MVFFGKVPRERLGPNNGGLGHTFGPVGCLGLRSILGPGNDRHHFDNADLGHGADPFGCHAHGCTLHLASDHNSAGTPVFVLPHNPASLDGSRSARAYDHHPGYYSDHYPDHNDRHPDHFDNFLDTPGVVVGRNLVGPIRTDSAADTGSSERAGRTGVAEVYGSPVPAAAGRSESRPADRTVAGGGCTLVVDCYFARHRSFAGNPETEGSPVFLAAEKPTGSRRRAASLTTAHQR